MGPPFLRGGEKASRDIASVHRRLQSFNGAALFTGRRVTKVAVDAFGSQLASMGPPFLRGGETSTAYSTERSTTLTTASMGPPFLRGGERAIHDVLDAYLSRLQWGRPFYGAESRRSITSCPSSCISIRFNGAALFTGRRDHSPDERGKSP